MQTIKIKIEDLRLDETNVLTHEDRDVEAIARSLSRFGQQKPIVVSSDNWVAAGNGTAIAARSLGWTEVDAVRSELSAEEIKAYSIADNQTGRLAPWNRDNLSARLEEIRKHDETLIAAVGLPESDLRSLLANWQGDLPDWESSEFERVVDREEPTPIDPPKDPRTKPGDLWILGDHRLLCGDCRDWNDVDRLLDGSRINVALTSPPYADRRKYDEGSEFRPITPEDYVDWFRSVADNVEEFLAEDGSFFLNIKAHCEEGQRLLYVFDLVLAFTRRWGWRFVDELSWVHGGTPKSVMGRFKNGFEPIYHFTRRKGHKIRPKNVQKRTQDAILDEKKSKERVSDRTGWESDQGRGGGVRVSISGESLGDVTGEGFAYPSNVLSFGLNREALGHSAAFPTKLPRFFIAAYSDPGDVVFDPFLGSGSTLIAAEELGRLCYGLEISPRYCDVVVQRWEASTGKSPQLVRAEEVESNGDQSND